MADFRAEVGFDSSATDAVVKWTDVTPWFSGLDTQSGRSTELNAIETGTASFTWDNADGRFTPGRSTITMLSERFNAAGVVGPDLFAFDSGEWLRSGPLAMTLTSGTSGVTVTAVGAGLSDSVAIRLNSRGVPVVAGQLVTVTVRAAVTCTSALTNYVIKAQYDSDVARDVATSTGGAVTSNGALVTASATFTVPAGATFVRPRLDGFPTSGAVGTLALTAAYVRVDLANPYAGKLDARNPIRAYTRFDDNYLHMETANANLIDPDQPRWTGKTVETLPKACTVRALFDPVKGRDVFDMQGFWVTTGTSPQASFDSGLAGDSDIIHVKAGDVVAVDADAMRPGPFVADAFGRTVSGGWGSTDTGAQPWSNLGSGGTVLASDFNVASGVGTHSVPVALGYRLSYLAGLPVNNTDAQVTYTLPATAVTGGPIEPAGIMLRVQSATSYYLGRISVATTGAITASVRRIEGTTETVLGTATSPYTWAASVALRVRAQALAGPNGPILRLKVWPVLSAEPATWDVWITDTATGGIPAAGAVGIRSGVATGNTNTKPIVFAYDNFAVTDLDVSGMSAGYTLQAIHTPYGGADTVGNTATPVAALSTWEHLSTSYTAPSDGYMRVRLLTLANDFYPRLRACNVKVRVNGIGTSAVAAISGVAPAFRGFVEKWAATPSATIGQATATCVDTLSVLNQPLDTLYRARAKVALTAGAQSPTYYWPCVEGSDTTTTTMPVLGNLPLTVLRTNTAPETGGFTTDKTFIYSDGEDAGGFKVEDTDPALGAVLVLGSPSTPNVLSPGQFTFTMWSKLTALPASNGRLIAVWNTPGIGLVSLDVLANGSLQGQLRDQTNTLVAQATTSAGTIVAGKAQFITLSFVTSVATGFKAVLSITADGTQASATTAAVYVALPKHTHIQFGGIIVGTTNQWFINGSINHITLVNGLPPVDPTNPLVPKYIDTLRNTNLDTSFQDVGMVHDEVSRLNALLGSLGVAYPGSKAFDAPLSTLIAARWNQDDTAFDALANAADFAGGTFLAGPAGELVYQNRRRRAGARVLWTLREHQDGASWELDEARVVNTAVAERSTGARRTATDAASVLKYGPKAATLTRDVVDEQELTDAAAWYVARYKQAIPRCETVVVDASTADPVTDPDLIGLAYAGSVGDRLLLADLPPTAPADQSDMFIEGVSRNVTVDGSRLRWVTTLNVSSAQGSDAWVLEDAVSGVLDSAFCVTTY